jgi:1,4-alpha-glucan branching enzyme
MSECYIPLLRVFDRLDDENVPFHLTISLSPTLIQMLSDRYYQDRYRSWVKTMMRLLTHIPRGETAEQKKSRSFYRNFLNETLDYFEMKEGNLLRCFKGHADSGNLTLITTAATHALLPAYRSQAELVDTQVSIGMEVFKKHFDAFPEGFWMPEMAYYTGLDDLLVKNGIRYTFCDTRAVYLNGNPPESGHFGPSISPGSLVFFPGDPALSMAVWSAQQGYPGDHRYREFHHDYIYALPDHILEAEGIDRLPAGLKLYAITGETMEKHWYDPEAARQQAMAHAKDFMDKTNQRTLEMEDRVNHPVFTLPFDMELFGHWWFEGPLFIEELCRLVSKSPATQLESPGELASNSDLPSFTPAESSWGGGGLFSTWYPPQLGWLYPRLHDIYYNFKNATGDIHPVIREQLLREICLAQSSDWVFMIANGHTPDFAMARLQDHVHAAEHLSDQVTRHDNDPHFAESRKEEYPLFPDIIGKYT